MKDVTIPEGLGEGDTFVHDGLRFTIKKGDLTVRDLDLGEYLYEEPASSANTKAYKARTLAIKHLDELRLLGMVYSESEPYVSGRGGTQKANVLYLTLYPLHHLVPMTRTRKGRELRLLMTRVFIAWQEGKPVSPGELDAAPQPPAVHRHAQAGEGRQVTSHKGFVFANLAGRLHVHGRSLAEALCIQLVQLEANLAARPHVAELGPMPDAPNGFWCDESHVDFALKGDPSTEGARAILAVMQGFRNGNVAIADGRFAWNDRAERMDPLAYKILKAHVTKTNLAMWDAQDMLRDASGVARARHSNLAAYFGVAEPVIREAISDGRILLERTERIEERTENLHGHSVIGLYLTVSQSRMMAAALGRNADLGEEPFISYFAFKTKAQEAADAKDGELVETAIAAATGTDAAPEPPARLSLASLLSRIKPSKASH